jgi:hypothetical protein
MWECQLLLSPPRIDRAVLTDLIQDDRLWVQLAEILVRLDTGVS